MLLQAGPQLTVDIGVVFAIVAVAVVLFVSEAIPSDITALSVLVSLVVLQEYTGVDAEAALSGFASTATITILAMYILSAGVQRTGVVDRLEHVIARYAGDSPRRLLGATVGITGPLAGVVNNTPVVALFIPMITKLADRTHTSPSKFLLPLSYAAMLGGTLTLIGTSTNLLASSVAADLGVDGTPFSMFQFTPLGLLVLAVGSVYLLTVGPMLLPSRIEPHDVTEEFGLGGRLSRVYVPESSILVGRTPAEARTDGVKILQLLRGDETFVATDSDRAIEAGDVLTIRAEAPAAQSFVDLADLRRLPRADVTEEELALGSGRGTLAEVIVPGGSGLIGQAVADTRLEGRFSATVLAARRGDSLVVEDVGEVRLSEGDGLLIYATQNGIDHLEETGELLVTETVGDTLPEPEPIDWREAGLAVGIVLGVIAVAAADLLAISVAALGGVVAMVVSGVIEPERAYAAVNWEVIFLLAGVIPLGLAMDRTGAAAYLAAHVTDVSTVLPAVGTVALFYLLTGLLANLITPVASVALVLPIAVSTAADLGANAFAFVLAVTFAGSTAFMTPMGYQTNLMVYSPGGYRFTDYLRIGAPLQLLLAVVTTLGIAAIWGV